MEPLKEGYMHKAHPKDRLLSVTVWQKRYFVLWSKGILEYYTNYEKKAEDYCGTLNLEDCHDMEAPITIGKRHNVIKLSVMKESRLKDYWLDCDCPPVLNEWVKYLSEASGLTPEDIKANGQNMKPLSVSSKDAIIQKRPLPVPPPDSSLEYVLSDDQEDDESGGVYTEIEDEPGNVQTTWFPARRYTRSTSLKRHIEAVQDNIATSSLLKREAIPNVAGSPPVARKPLPPPKLPKPGQQQPSHKSRSEPNVSSTMGAVDFDELKQKLNRRLSKSPETEYIGQDELEEQMEYEEVQFNTDIIIGTPRLPKPTTFPFELPTNNEIKEPAEYLKFERKSADINSYSPSLTPSVPPRDNKPSLHPNDSAVHPPAVPPRVQSSPESTPNETNKPTREKPLPSKPRKKDPLSLSIPPPHPNSSSPPLPPPRPNGSSSPVPPPRPNGSSSPLPPPRLKDTSSPPLPPSRKSNTPSPPSSPPNQRDSPPPPPIPKRIPGQSDRRGITRYNSVSDTSSKGHHRIKPYRTTEIRNPESDTGSSSDQSSGDMLVRHSLSFDEKDLINTLPSEDIMKTTPTKSNKPLPPVKPRSTNYESSAQKSKLTNPRSPSPQTSATKTPNDLRPSHVSAGRQNTTPTDNKMRPPALLPKPKVSKLTLPPKADLNQSCSPLKTPPSTNDFSTSSEHDFNGSDGRYPSPKVSKRPPLPLPKPRV